jgi:NADH dehydrogenase [ubiquinone] 1 alpha subcomplex assembly factor 7
VNALLAEICDEIARTGPITVARYMDLALYHPKYGYYSSGNVRTGRGGHFLTSSELDPAFGELWCGEFVRVWDDCGRPEAFALIEIGPGEAGFARAVLEAASGPFARALRIYLVEPIPRLRRRQADRLGGREKVTWSEAVSDVPRGPGVVFVNEVLDNLPVHLVDGDDEIYVDVSGGSLSEARGRYSRDVAVLLAHYNTRIPPDVRAEIPVAAQRFVRTSTDCITRGAAIFVDYGDLWPGLLGRTGGTLACYSSSGADDLYLERPGEKDITAHANWSVACSELRASGCTVTGPVAQRKVLDHLGLRTLQQRLRNELAVANEDGDGLGAVRAMSRRGALGALADPSGLGALGVVLGAKGIPPRLV